MFEPNPFGKQETVNIIETRMLFADASHWSLWLLPLRH
jgi:hypothetical protein